MDSIAPPIPPHNRRRVLVTGATGHLGSWLVMHLLEQGYMVRAAVRDPADKTKVDPLLHALDPSLRQYLQIVKANLIVDGDYDAVVEGCDGVFHLASPVDLDVVLDPQKDMIDPAVQGCLNVLKSCVKSKSVKRVVYASSAASALTADKIKDESSWSDVNMFINNTDFLGWDYIVAKTLAEKAAIKLAEEHNLDLVILNPTTVMGPFITPQIPFSVKGFLSPITGRRLPYGLTKTIPSLHIEDVTRAFIFLYETSEAKGRYICNGADAHIRDIVDEVKRHYPDAICDRTLGDKDFNGEDANPGFDSSKLKKLGFEFLHSSVQSMTMDGINCCRAKALRLE